MIHAGRHLRASGAAVGDLFRSSAERFGLRPSTAWSERTTRLFTPCWVVMPQHSAQYASGFCRVAMIKKDQIMQLLLEACPSFSQRWAEHRAYYGDEDLPYAELGEFAHHLVDLLKSKRKQEFPAVFEVIERLHVEGDDYVREAATIGALEGIQNVAGNSGVDPEEFVEYLRPVSLNWWRQLNDFWEGKIP